MTEPLGQVERSAGGGLAGAIGPEAVAALLSIVVVVALVGARFVAVGGGAVGPSPSPSSAATDVPTRTAPTFDVAAAQNLLIINQNLYRLGDTLQSQLDPPPGVDTDRVRNTFSNMKLQLDAGTNQATILARTPVGTPAGSALLEVYAKIDGIIEATSNSALTSQPPWQKAAADVVATLKLLPPLDDQLTMLLAGPPPSPSSLPSSGPSTAPSASAVPSTTPAPSPTAAPSVATSPTPPPSVPASVGPSVIPTAQPGPNAVLNPGFEDASLSPWKVALTQSADATLSADGVDPFDGKLSARIDINQPSLTQAPVSLQQSGLAIEAGAYYQVSVALRASGPRDVVVRIASATGSTLGTGSRRFPINQDWSVVTFPMTSIMPSDNASIAIDVGGSAETVWVDDVSVARLNPGAP